MVDVDGGWKIPGNRWEKSIVKRVLELSLPCDVTVGGGGGGNH